ncbi:MAG: hypothetical protein WCL30_03870 [Pseudomonadota bacterium]
MSMIGTKIPSEIKDYSLDWSKDIGNDVIVNNSNSVWTVSPADMTITQGTLASNSTLTTVWLSGGSVGTVYYVRNTIITTSGRNLSKVFRVLVVDNNFL